MFCFFLILKQSHPRIPITQNLMKAPIGVSTNQEVNVLYMQLSIEKLVDSVGYLPGKRCPYPPICFY